MSTTFGPPISLDGPPPRRYPFGLLSVADEVAEGRWGMGAQIDQYPPDLPLAHDPCSSGSTRIKSSGSIISRPIFGAFDGYVPVTCTRRGIDSVAEFKRKANVALEIRDQWILEKQLLTGEFFSANPSLDDADVDYLGSVGLNEGLNRLEDAIADTGQQGVILAPPGIVAAWGETKLYRDGRFLRTTQGTPVVAGQGFLEDNGFTVTGGAASTATKHYAFAIGFPMYGRSEIPDFGGDDVFLDRSDNTFTYRAERSLFVAWDKQLQAAVLVDRSA